MRATNRTVTRAAARTLQAAGGRSLLLICAIAATLALPASALAATPPSPPTVTSAFGPGAVSIGSTSALSITITNPNTSATLTGIAFNDTLPAGVVVDDPTGESGACGSTTAPAPTPGSSTFSLTGGTLKAGVSCTVSVAVTSSTPGTYTNDTGPITASQTVTKPYAITGSDSTAALTVIGNPTITIAAPVNNAKIAYGKTVDASFTCTEAAGGPGLTSCTGSNTDGSNVNDGGPIDTTDAGVQTFTVIATSADGAIVMDSVNYTVSKKPKLGVSKVYAKANGSITFKLAASAAGKVAIDASFTRRGHTVTETKREKIKKNSTVTLTPSAKLKAFLAPIGHRKRSSVKVTLSFTYTPSTGKSTTTTLHGRLA